MYVCMYVCDLSSPADRSSRSSSSLGEFSCPPAGSVFRPIYWLAVAKQIKRSLTVEFSDQFQGTHTHCSCGPKGGSFQITVCVGTVQIVLLLFIIVLGF